MWVAPLVSAAETNQATGKFLLLDRFGRSVVVPTNKVPAGLLPPPRTGLQHQFPEPERGTSLTDEALERSRAAAKEFRWLPSVPPPLMPYLGSLNEYGNTVARPGPLISSYPLEPLVQCLKYRLSDNGFRYSFQQTLTFVGLTEVMQGDDTLAFYTLQLKGKWAIYSASEGDASGWITTQVGAKTGLNDHSNTQDARRNLGTVTDPTGIWSSVNGIRVPELAWQQALCGGRVVAVAGMVNQRN